MAVLVFFAGGLESTSAGLFVDLNCRILSVISRFLVSLSSNRRFITFMVFMSFAICFDWPFMILACFLYIESTEESLDFGRTTKSSLGEDKDELDEFLERLRESPARGEAMNMS